jgi:hypothetical protein
MLDRQSIAMVVVKRILVCVDGDWKVWEGVFGQAGRKDWLWGGKMMIIPEGAGMKHDYIGFP